MDEYRPSAYRTTAHAGTLRHLVKEWCVLIHVDPGRFSTHSLRRTKNAAIYDATHNLAACQLLLGHRIIGSTAHYLGVDNGKRWTWPNEWRCHNFPQAASMVEDGCRPSRNLGAARPLTTARARPCWHVKEQPAKESGAAMDDSTRPLSTILLAGISGKLKEEPFFLFAGNGRGAEGMTERLTQLERELARMMIVSG